MQVSIGPTALCVGVALFIFSFSFPPRGAKTRLRRVHYGPKIARSGSPLGVVETNSPLSVLFQYLFDYCSPIALLLL